MNSSRRWASIISSIASFAFFTLIILRIPLFKVPCRAGMCKSPLELTCSHIMGSKLIPERLVKSVLYPGAIANSLFTNKSIISFHNFLHSHQSFSNNNFVHLVSHDLQGLEVVVGSYMSVGGSLIGLVKPGRLSLVGTLLAMWGLFRELTISIRRSEYNIYLPEDEGVYVYPAMYIALISAFLSVRKDIRKIHGSFTAPPILKPKLV